MSDAATNGLTMGFNIILACMIASLAIFLMMAGRNLTSVVGARISNTNANILNDELVQFDGTTVTGADVVNCIKKYSNSIEIVIHKYCGKNKDEAVMADWSTRSLVDGKFQNYPSYAYDDMLGNPLADGQLYVNPNAKFTGSVARNANGAISSLSFTQTEYHQDAYEVPDAGNTTVVINNTNNDTSAALATAIAGLTTASATLNDAIQNIQETGTGASTVQAQTLAILQTLSDEVLPGMSEKIDELSSATGTDPTITQDISNIQSKVNQMYDIIINEAGGAGGGSTSHNVDEIYEHVSSMSESFKELQISMSQLVSGIDAMTTKLSNEHTEILRVLNEIKADQVEQDTKLDALLTQLSGGASADAALESFTKTLASRNANIQTYGDLCSYSQTDSSYTAQMQELQKQYDELMYCMNAVSESYKSFNQWLNENTGGA